MQEGSDRMDADSSNSAKPSHRLQPGIAGAQGAARHGVVASSDTHACRGKPQDTPSPTM